jgi:hypothetical protein
MTGVGMSERCERSGADGGRLAASGSADDAVLAAKRTV